LNFGYINVKGILEYTIVPCRCS